MQSDEIELDNGPAPSSMVMHPRTKRVVDGFVDSTGQPLSYPPALSSIARFATTSVPINLAAGTASAVLLGDFRSVILGIRQDCGSRFSGSGPLTTCEYGFLAHLRADVAVTHPPAFCAVTGIDS